MCFSVTDEAFAQIPRDKRPAPDELEGYERQYDFDPDYGAYRREQADFVHDYRREEEENRARGNDSAPLMGHENEFLVEGGRRGFDRDSFDLDAVARKVASRPLH